MIFTDWPWRHWRGVRGDAVALRLEQASLNWRELCELIDVLAQGLAQQGVSAGDGVALCAANGPRTLLAWLALLQCGARIVPLNPRLPPSLLSALLPGLTLRYGLVLDEAATLPGLQALQWPESPYLPASGPCFTASAERVADGEEALVNEAVTIVAPLSPSQGAAAPAPSVTTTLPADVTIDTAATATTPSSVSSTSLSSAAIAPYAHSARSIEDDNSVAVEWDPSRFVSMTLTSGSSGLPKAAVHTAAAHLASAEGLLALMPFHAQDNWLLSLPLFHVSGQGIFWRWLLAGGCLTVRDLHPLHTALEGCTHASLVPTQLWRLLSQTHMPEKLHSVLLGGAAIPVDLTQQAQARGIRCWCGYGMTELASTVCAKYADGLADVGAALAGREVRIVNDEILIRAASLASGYWRDGALLALTDSEGWFHTRDRGVLANGRLTVLGRLDNLFFSGGEGIQPEDVERVINAHPQVSQCFVVPVADAEFGHRPVAVVECDNALCPETLAEWVGDKLVRFQQPVRWLRLPQVLKNGGIKVSRREVQRWVDEMLRNGK
ncbi:o-succinylbenzoate--CoA ligase [Enterobacteriaceae bacterium 4M9]|nr:o-succinylbenzoate--CoA ligase [Enterobacteriaceae bacterium 4M9]